MARNTFFEFCLTDREKETDRAPVSPRVHPNGVSLRESTTHFFFLFSSTTKSSVAFRRDVFRLKMRTVVIIIYSRSIRNAFERKRSFTTYVFTYVVLRANKDHPVCTVYYIPKCNIPEKAMNNRPSNIKRLPLRD